MPTKKSYTPDEAYARLANYCAASEHSAMEVRRKLRLWELPSELSEAIVGRLEQEGFLDLERFAHAFVRDKYRFNGWGPMRLRAELRKHQLPTHLIDEALASLEDELEENEDDQLERLLASKLRSLPRGLERRKAFDRLMRFGLYRGYPLDEVREVTLGLLDEDDEAFD